MLITHFKIFVLFHLVEYSATSFGYTRRQQHLWAQKFKMCSGKMQSPIAITSRKSVVLPLPALEIIGFHDFMSGSVVLKNNGNSVSLIFAKQNWTKRPHIFGAMLMENRTYVLEGLHFHWGSKNSRGSEHTLNGVSYPMEMHIIFRNSAYPELQKALDNADGLAVLAVFFQLQEDDNEQLGPIVKVLPTVQWINTEAKLNATFTLSSLLPTDTDTYYTYRGSLTTPPCSEAVTWMVFSKTVPISFKQMDKFRILSNGEDTLAVNYRKLQHIGNRKVYMRKLTSIFANRPEMISGLNVSDLDWYWH